MANDHVGKADLPEDAADAGQDLFVDAVLPAPTVVLRCGGRGGLWEGAEGNVRIHVVGGDSRCPGRRGIE
jgi:hypothetical protein